jgi:Herelleviridae exonuclease
MRGVNFIEVGMENFGPYIDPMVLEFPNNSLTLLTGPNGIGKTMALDSLTFTLYGVTSKGARGDDVVNNVVGRNCHTWTIFYIEKDKYRVDRYHKYTKFGNTVLISVNDGEPYKKGQKEVLPEIERLICPLKSFSNTLMFGQKVKDFFTDLVDSDKKEIFRKILSIDRYQKYYNRAKELVDAARKAIADIANSLVVGKNLLDDAEEHIKNLEERKKQFYQERDFDIKNLEQAIKTNELLLENWRKKLENFQSMKQQLGDNEKLLLEFESKEKMIEKEYESDEQALKSQIELKLSELKQQAGAAKNAIRENAQRKAQEKKDDFAKLFQRIAEETESLLKEKGDLDVKMSKCEDAVINAEIEINELQVGLQGSSCPTCLQVITEECVQHLESKIAEKRVVMHEYQTSIKDFLKPKRKEILERISKISEDKQKALKIMEVDIKDITLISEQEIIIADGKLDLAIKKLDEAAEIHRLEIEKSRKDKLTPIYEKKQKLMEKAKEQHTLEESIDEVEMTITTLERDIARKKDAIKTKEETEFDNDQINHYVKKRSELKLEIANAKTEMKVVEEDLEAFEFWKVGFSARGIPSMLIDESIPFMNRKVAQYLDKLTNGRYIVSFDTLAETKSGEFRDKISVNVLDTHTRANSRIQLSGGQTRIIDIATILTLGDLQSNIQDVSFNILIFDEIFDSLDEENIGFVSKVLSNMKLGKSIYLISHRHEDQLEADEILTLN